MLSGRGDAARRPLERASPGKLQPAANVGLNSCLWLQKLALAPQSRLSSPQPSWLVWVTLARSQNPAASAAEAYRHGSDDVPRGVRRSYFCQLLDAAHASRPASHSAVATMGETPGNPNIA